jgi:hypothetical protein
LCRLQDSNSRRTCTVLAPMCYTGSDVLYWLRCAVLAPMCYTGSDVLYWLRCAILAPMCYTGSDVLYWLRCTILAPMCYTGSDVLYWLRCAILARDLVNLPAKHKGVRTAMPDGGFAYRLHPSSLTTSWRQQSAQRETVSLSGRCACEERTSTCGVSSSGNVKVWYGPRASQPVRNRSRAQISSIATASK